MSEQREHYCIAIVGGGPRATYACERLAAEVEGRGPRSRSVSMFTS